MWDLDKVFYRFALVMVLHRQEYNEPSLWEHKLTAWESGTDCSWVTKNVTCGRAGPCDHLRRAANTSCQEATETHHLRPPFKAVWWRAVVQVYRSVLVYLFCYAQRAKSICSVQIQVVLGPADNLFLTFPFGVSLKNSKDRNKRRWNFLALGEFAWVVQHFSSKLQKTSSKKPSVLTPKLTMHATPQCKAIILLTKGHLGYGVRKYN